MAVGGSVQGRTALELSEPVAGPARVARSAVADRPGEVIGTTRLLGGFVTPQNSDAGPIWCINGNMGNMYLFTADGLFVAQLFQDMRRGRLGDAEARARHAAQRPHAARRELLAEHHADDATAGLSRGRRADEPRARGRTGNASAAFRRPTLTVTADDLQEAARVASSKPRRSGSRAAAAAR